LTCFFYRHYLLDGKTVTFCLVKGNALANTFPVDIEKNQLVGHLKKVIKTEKAPEFDHFPADKLKLWNVKIPDDQDDLLRNLTPQ
jgi:hypothetical protein